MSDVSSDASREDRSDSQSSDGEDEFYDVEVKKDTTDYASTTSQLTTEEETVKLKIEEYSANEDFRERFFEAQERLGELEAELKNTRERLRNLEDACENTEEKIGVLKNAAFSYHRSFSEHEITFKTVVEENKELKITTEKLQAFISKNKQEREKSDEIKRTINEHLKDQLDAAAKENEELERELDELKNTNSKQLRDVDTQKKKTPSDSCLVQELESLKLKFDTIETEKNHLQKEKEGLRDEVDDLEKKLKGLQQKLSTDDEIIEEMKQQILEYHSQIAESEEKCDSSRSRNIELEREMSVLRGLMAELESKLEDEKERGEDLIHEGTQQLELQNRKISQLEMNLRDVCKEKELLNLQFVDSKNKSELDMKQWTKQLNEAHVRAELFRKEVSDKEKKLAALRAENEELRGLKDDVASLQRQLQDAHDRELARFDEELSGDDTDGGKDDELMRLRQENEELNQEVEQLRDDVISLQSDLAEFVQEAEKAKNRLDIQNAAPLAVNESDLSDYEEVNEGLAVVVGESPNLVGAPPEETTASWSSDDFTKSHIQELEERLEHSKEEKKRLEDCLEESEDRAKKTVDELSKTIDNLTEKCEMMRKDLVEKEITINKLRKDEAQDKKCIHDLEEKLLEQDCVEKELQKAREELHDLKLLAAKEDYTERYEELKARYDKTVDDMKKMENEIEEVTKVREKLKDQLEEVNKTLEKGKDMYAEVCDENDDLKKEKKKLDDEVKFLTEELKEEEDLHTTEKEKLDKEIKDLREKIRRLETEIAELNVNLKAREDEEDWRKKHDALRREVNSLQSDKKRLERNLEKTEDEHEDTKSKYNKARRELHDSLSEVGTLQRQVSELKLSKDTEDIEKELRKFKEALKKSEDECEQHVERLKDLEKEMTIIKVTLNGKEEESERHLQELEELKRLLSLQKTDGAWQERFESLKLKLDEVEDEKNSLQKEKNNLQNELRKDSEKLAEVEIKLSQANVENEGLSKDFQKSHMRITHLELELQRASKQKEQAEEKAKSIKNELLTREETINRLGKELSDKNKIIEGIDDSVDKDNEILMLEREIQLLQSRIPASEKDESVLHNQIHLLEINVKEVREQLDGKTTQLEESEKNNEKLSHRVVELSKEIQSLYRRYEESRAQLVKFQGGGPVVRDKAETTSLTIDVEGKPEVELGVFVQERVRSLPRCVTPGHGRSVSELDFPVSQLPGTVIIGEPVALTVDYNARGSPVVSHPSELTASEPEDNDEASSSQESEDEAEMPPVVFAAQDVYSAPPLPPSYSPPAPNPERILIGSQALPEPQRPKSIDTERFPFLKGSNVKLNAGAFQPVSSRTSGQAGEDVDERLPQKRFRAWSREELFRLDGLLHAHAVHQDPSEDGQGNEKKEYPTDQVYVEEEDYPQDGEEWPNPPSYEWERREEPPIPPAEEVCTIESMPDREHYPEDCQTFPDPYEIPPRKPENTYERKIIGVYSNDGNLIGYQEVYEEKADDYLDEINGGVMAYSNPYGHGKMEKMPNPYDSEQYPLVNVPHSKDARNSSEDNLEYWYDRNGNTSKGRWNSREEPDERRFTQTKYNRQNDSNYRHGYSDPYGHLNGDNYRRSQPSEVVRQYASGTYL